MINLIPPAAKKSVIREYWKRVITVWLLLFSSALIILVVFLLPTYVALQTEIGLLDEKVAVNAGLLSAYDVSATELVTANAQAKLLLDSESEISLSEIIIKLDTIAGKDVSINNYIFESKIDNNTIVLSGVAVTRQALALFKDTIGKEEEVASVDLPIPNLIKDKDLIFTMTIKMASSSKNI